MKLWPFAVGAVLFTIFSIIADFKDMNTEALIFAGLGLLTCIFGMAITP